MQFLLPLNYLLNVCITTERAAILDTLLFNISNIFPSRHDLDKLFMFLESLYVFYYAPICLFYPVDMLW